MSFSGTGGLPTDVNEYLNRKVTIPTETTTDLNTGETVVTGSTTMTVREIICGLLAGNGLKLPNIQMCLKINLGRLIDELPEALADLKAELELLEQELDNFLAHTNIENVVQRLNQAVADVAAVANMINFCGTPINPRPIPNFLGDMFGSFTGTGKQLLDALGQMATSDIGGCIGADGKFNPDLFTSGLLNEIGQYWNDLGNIPQATLDSWKSFAQGWRNDIRNLMDFENTASPVSDKGGSIWATIGPDRTNTNVGVVSDPANMTIGQAQSIASGLVAAKILDEYEVDGEGNSIFDYLLEPELKAKLLGGTDSDSDVGVNTRLPTYDYCGRIIGYTDVPVQDTGGDTSAGDPISTPSTDPGSVGVPESGVTVHPPANTTTNLNNNTPTTSTGSTDLTGYVKFGDLTVQNNPAGTSSLTYDPITGTFTYTPPLDGGGGGGIGYQDLSVTQNTASGSGTLAFNQSNGVFTYTPPNLSNFLTAEADTLGTVTARNATTSTPTTIDTLTTDDLTINSSLTWGGTGAMTINSGSTINLQAQDTISVDQPFRLANTTTSAVLSPQAGDLIFDTSDNKAKCYDGTTWQNLF